MTWKRFDGDVAGTPAQVLLDTRFAAGVPGEQLPDLSWIGLWCRMTPEGGYWHPDETDALDRIEGDLIGLADRHGNGWVVYVRRLATPGVREYFFYSGGDADLAQVVPALEAAHPGYRIEYDRIADPAWKQYGSWVAAAT